MPFFTDGIGRAPPNHFSAGMMWRGNPVTNEIEFLTILYTEVGRGKPTRKFPGGTNRLSRAPLAFRDETATDTLGREWKTEVGQILHSRGNNPAIFRLRDHTQYFFLLDESDAEGEFRTVELVDKEKGRPDEVLGPPEWTPVEELMRTMRGNHLLALRVAFAAVQRIRGVCPEPMPPEAA